MLFRSPQPLARCLADLTALRDRELLQQRLSTHLSDHFQARQARLWRRPDARLDAWEPELLRGHSPWPDLPLARQMALGHERPVHLGSQVGRAYYPLPAGSSGAVVLELQLDQPATELHQQLANEMLRVARNVVGQIGRAHV